MKVKVSLFVYFFVMFHSFTTQLCVHDIRGTKKDIRYLSFRKKYLLFPRERNKI